MTRPNDATAELPDLLTVEEAARLIRVGRTKAYAMAREWRDSGGRNGLPVVDFGHVLRVPRRALERLIGAELRAPTVLEPELVIVEQPRANDSEHPTTEARDEARPAPRPVVPEGRPRRRRRRPADPASHPTLPFAG